MRKLIDGLMRDLLLVAAGALFIGFAAWEIPRQARAQPSLLGPNIIAYTAVTTAQSIIAANPTRHALQICNAGATNILWIAPLGTPIATGFANAVTAAITPAANGAGTVGVPVATAGGVVTCFAPPVNAPSIGQGWAGFSTTTPVTIYEWP